MNNKIYKLIYFSDAVHSLGERELLEILKQARQHNQAQNITGVLLYCDGNIIQVLEGEREAVDALYRKIAQDPRHSGLIRLHGDYADERDFPDWSMGFEHIDVHTLSEHVSGLNHLTDHNLPSETLDNLSMQVRRLIKVFRHTSGLG